MLKLQAPTAGTIAWAADDRASSFVAEEEASALKRLAWLCYRLEPTDGGTQLTLLLKVTPTGIIRFTQSMVARELRQQMEADSIRLKALLSSLGNLLCFDDPRLPGWIMLEIVEERKDLLDRSRQDESVLKLDHLEWLDRLTLQANR